MGESGLDSPGSFVSPEGEGWRVARLSKKGEEVEGDVRTFWKGSEYFQGLKRSDFKTCGFPGHTLFLESILCIRDTGTEGNQSQGDTQRSRENSAARD